jgi:Cytochrome c554 and c-prime
MDQEQQATTSDALPGPAPVPSPPRRRRFLAVLAGLILLVGSGSACYWFFLRDAPLPPDPRVTYKGPYLNVDPRVAYVGDAVCARCHKDVADRFSHHPMGRSMQRVADVLPRENFTAEAKNPFESKGFRYDVERRGNSLWHSETKLDANKEVVYKKEMEVQYILGSRTHGGSYLVVQDGQVWQSPISWYTEKQRWDLAPGYTTQNVHFERPVTAECLQCHSNKVVSEKDTVNRYQEPLFRGLAIGCERCHGPGDLHVRRQGAHASETERDYTIVNPARLDPVLRDAVCQQCHLAGELRIPRLGRDFSDFRPGLPLHYFLAVFSLPSELVDPRKAVSQDDQMPLSMCYKKSKGELGCITCHELHKAPTAEKKTAYYRDRCLSCHEAGLSCSLSLPRRKKVDDNCVACHMPANSSSNIAHTSITDHRILIRPQTEAARGKPPAPDEIPLVFFHRDLDDPASDTQNRDLGIALARLARQANLPHLARLARPLLETSLKRYPADPDSDDALGLVLWMGGEQEEAYRLQKRLLQQSPRHEHRLELASYYARELGRLADMLEFEKRLVEINPNHSDYQVTLAELLSNQKQWAPALAAAQAALKLNPARLDARRLIILCHLRLGEKRQAETAKKAYLTFNPADAETVERWFD